MFRDYSAAAPDAVSMIYGLHLDDEGTPIVIVSYNHSGEARAVADDTAGLRRGPEPVSVSEASEPYLEVQTAHDLVLGSGHRSYIKGLYANELRSEALDALVAHMTAGPPQRSFSVTAQGGAIARVPDDAMAFTGRTARFDLSADATWDDPADDDASREWVRAAMALVEADAIEGRYANENADAGPAETRLIYGDAAVAKLADLKRTWDPDNVFRSNHNVAPAAG